MTKPKRLYVLRHGNAVPYGYDQDELRELTDLGVIEVKAAANAFREKNVSFDKVFVSPYVRAQQTAKVFFAELDMIANIEDLPLITPDGQPMEVAAWLNEQPYHSVLLVTHQPFAYQFVDYLVDEPLPMNFSMTTATMAAVEGELFVAACCQLKWSISST